ncbi:MAG TPA: AI-2E family transporter [Propionicimonas sp.]|jgi:predicted PurR-regulated permease PerM
MSETAPPASELSLSPADGATAPAAAATPVVAPVPPVEPAAAQRAPHRRIMIDLGHPFVWGFTATVGALVALSLAGALSSLSTVLVSIGVALFVALALDPLVRWLEGHGMGRGISIGVVFAGFAVILGGVLALVVPTAVVQITAFAKAVPGYISDMQNADWFKNLVALSGSSDMFANILGQAQTWLSDPANLLAIGGGALAVGTGLVNAISGTLIVLVLTLYFLASLRSMTSALERLAPAHARPQLAEITEQITESVGGYVSGMAILAFFNAIFAFILMLILNVPFAALLAFLALLITMIPMVGPVLFWLLASVVILFTSPLSALIFAAVYFAYMQVEAYVMTPKVMNKAVDIPGSLVLIGALVGGTLLGLLGALVAVPVTASLLMIVNTVFIPRQDAKLQPS